MHLGRAACSLFCVANDQALVYAELYGAARGPAAYGLERLMNFPLVFLGAPMVGALFEATGSYRAAALVCGASQLCGAGFYAFLHMYVRHAHPPRPPSTAASTSAAATAPSPPALGGEVT